MKKLKELNSLGYTIKSNYEDKKLRVSAIGPKGVTTLVGFKFKDAIKGLHHFIIN